MSEKKQDPMEVEEVLEKLNEALELQMRSTLQHASAAGSMLGLDVQGLVDRLWQAAQDDLADAKLVVEKITALGGDPTTNVGKLKWTSDPQETLERLIEDEDEAIAAFHAVIPHSGQEPRSEALEHLMEHVIMRKQNHVDWLRRAARKP